MEGTIAYYGTYTVDETGKAVTLRVEASSNQVGSDRPGWHRLTGCDHPVFVRCNVCHYPQSLAYPDTNATDIAWPKPRADNQEAGLTCASGHLTPHGKIRGPYPHVQDGPNVVYTVTYKKAAGPQREGTLDEGESVEIKNGTIFNVRRTDRS
jgi:hypothetical protein